MPFDGIDARSGAIGVVDAMIASFHRYNSWCRCNFYIGDRHDPIQLCIRGALNHVTFGDAVGSRVYNFGRYYRQRENRKLWRQVHRAMNRVSRRYYRCNYVRANDLRLHNRHDVLWFLTETRQLLMKQPETAEA